MDADITGQIAATQKQIADLEAQRGQETDTDKKAELGATITDAGDQLTRLQEQQYYERSADNLSRTDISVKSNFEPGRDIPNVMDALGLRDQVTTTIRETHLDPMQKQLYEAGIAYQELGQGGQAARQEQTRDEPEKVKAEDYLRFAAAPSQEHVPATPEVSNLGQQAEASDTKPAAPEVTQQEAEQAATERYAQDSGMEARHIEQGEEIEGEIADKVEINGKTYYAIEAENEQSGQPERVLVPAGETDHDPGDEITATHNGQSVDIEEAHSYGR